MQAREVTFLDHYDSFSMNVMQQLRRAVPGLHINRVFYDDAAAMLAASSEIRTLVVSPGPKRPEDLSGSLEFVNSHLGKVPVLGICLGHQILGKLHGSKIISAKAPHHGSTFQVVSCGSDPLLRDLPVPMEVARYNSLEISPPRKGWVIGKSKETDSIEIVRYDYEYPTYGVQFHPESFLSPCGDTLIRNYFALVYGSDQPLI